MWTVQAILRCVETHMQGHPYQEEFIAAVVEDGMSTTLHELFGTIFVGPVTVTYPPSKGRCTHTALPSIVCAIMHCPDRHNEVVSDIPEDVALVVEQGISLALEGRFEEVLVDRVMVDYSRDEGRRWRSLEVTMGR